MGSTGADGVAYKHLEIEPYNRCKKLMISNTRAGGFIHPQFGTGRSERHCIIASDSNMYNNPMLNFHMLISARMHRVKRFVCASSAHIYEFNRLERKMILKESDAWSDEPQDAHGLEKLPAKHFTKDFGIDRPCGIGHLCGIDTWKSGQELPTLYDYGICRIEEAYPQVANVEINKLDLTCTNMNDQDTVQGASSSSQQGNRYSRLNSSPEIPVISITKLIESSDQYKKIWEKALKKSKVPSDIGTEQFSRWLRCLSTPCRLVFSPEDTSNDTPHNNGLYIEVKINGKTEEKAFIDNGAGVNLCTYKLVNKLGYSSVIDSGERISISAYDGTTRESQGTITFQIGMGDEMKDTLFHVINLQGLRYDLLLGRGWISAMRAVPSTYHQCIKFPDRHGAEVTVHADCPPTKISDKGTSTDLTTGTAWSEL